MIVIVSDFGSFIRLHSERMIVVNRQAKTENEYPLIDLEGLLILNRGISITTDIIFECQKRMINITFIDKKSDIYVSFENENSVRDAEIIKNQVYAAAGSKGAEMTKAFILCKIKNQRAILKFFERNNNPGLLKPQLKIINNSIERIERYAESIKMLQVDDVEKFKKDIFILEAHTAHNYFKAIAQLVPEKIGFNGRVQKDPVDHFNIALNYCYGILRGLVSNYINKHGLSKYVGFLHSDACDRVSFTFDVMEEFRQITCDLPLLSFFRGNNELEVADGKLTLQSRRNLAAMFFAKLNNIFRCGDFETSLAEIVDNKIHEIKQVLLNKGSHKPFILKW